MADSNLLFRSTVIQHIAAKNIVNSSLTGSRFCAGRVDTNSQPDDFHTISISSASRARMCTDVCIRLSWPETAFFPRTLTATVAVSSHKTNHCRSIRFYDFYAVLYWGDLLMSTNEQANNFVVKDSYGPKGFGRGNLKGINMTQYIRSSGQIKKASAIRPLFCTL